MIQDPGPRQNLGFGIPIQRGPGDEEQVATGINAENGAVARALGDKPILKFAATMVAGLVSMSVAGKVARSGGYSFAEAASKRALESDALGKQLNKGLLQVRKMQKTLDELEGVTRVGLDGQLVDPYDSTVFAKRGKDGNWIKESVTAIDGAGFRANDDSLPDWGVRDEIQRRLVRQARRLPYELPGFYAADKLINDPILGNDQDRKVNWANPIDVLGDFAWESTKNVAFGVVPFEMGTGAASATYKRMMTNLRAPGGPGGDSLGYLTTQAVLEQVGVKAGEVVGQASRISGQALGAFSDAVQEASASGLSISDVFRKNGGDGITSARRAHNTVKNAGMNRTLTNPVLDAMPGPFSGFGSGVRKFIGSYKEREETYKNVQDVLSGKTTMSKLRAASDEGDAKKYLNVKSYLERGGGSHLDQMATQMERLGIHGVRTSKDIVSDTSIRGPLNNAIRENHYKDTLVQKLIHVGGLEDKQAVKFVTESAQFSFPSKKTENMGETLASRFRFSKNPSNAVDRSEWWREIQSQASGRDIDLSGITLDDFTDIARLAEASYLSPHQQRLINRKTQSHLQDISDNVFPAHVGKNIASRKAEYQDLKRSLNFNDNFLVRNTANSMGIKPMDNNGNLLDLNGLRNAISSRGIDADDNKRLLGYLVENKVVKAPWQRSGDKNLFGFSSVSIQHGLDTGYLGAGEKGVQAQIRNIAEARARSMTGIASGADAPITQAGLSALKMPGVYRSASGEVIDFGAIKKGIRAGVDALATETKIPILNFNPAQLAFYGASKSIRNASPIQFASKYSAQNVADRGMLGDDEFLMFLRTGNKSKGKLFGLSSDKLDGSSKIREFAGIYKPFNTNRDSMTGRLAELFLDRSSVPSSDNAVNRKGEPSTWKRLFHVSSDQPGNIFAGRDSLLGRIVSAARKKPDSYRQAERAARRIGESGFDPNSMDRNLSQGITGILDKLRGYGLNRKVTSNLMKSELIDPKTGLNIFNISSGTTASRAVKDVFEDDVEMNLSESGKGLMRSAQAKIRGLMSQADNETSFWDLPVPNQIKTTGVSTRLDQLKSEFSEYLVLREGAISPEDFGVKISGIIQEVDSMFSKGLISSAERSESRASILSLQLQHSRNKVYDTAKDSLPFNINKDTITDALGHYNNPDIKQLFREFGSFESGKKSLGSKVTGAFKRGLAPADAVGPDTVDAMGSKYTFIQTFGSKFEQNPLKAIKGLGTWSDPEALNSGTLYLSHMTTRLNKYFETIGLGLDLNQYGGPTDFYIRGLIGRRVAPAFIGGTAAVQLDRAAGGMVYEDEAGDPVHRPLVLGGVARGVVEGQAAFSGLVPGGQTYQEKKDELLTGEVPVRQGRFWLLNSNTPFKGGRVEYFRPSWYQRMMSGADYTPEMNETPLERLAFGYDYSPLRPLDPYRFERQNAESRPYPVSGDYFTGPWGPLTPLLNQTVGRVLKPSIEMNQEATTAALASYAPVGAGGAVSMNEVSQSLSGINASYSALAGTPGASSRDPFNSANNFTESRGIAASNTQNVASSISQMYSDVAQGGSYPGVFAPMLSQGLGGPGTNVIGAQVVPASGVQKHSTTQNRLGRAGFESQELAGIYGFAFGSARQGLGLGSQDFTPDSAVLESASRGYSASRSFWNLNLGGMGDMPLPIEGKYGNLEFSEIIRRFVPREQQGTQYINSIPNKMGQEYPWLPGPGTMNNLKEGDPYNMPDATIRLPGQGRDRVTERFGGSRFGGEYSMVDIHDMLADLDPFGDNFRQVDSMVDSYARSPLDMAKITQTRAQKEAIGIKNEFTPYQYKGLDFEDQVDEVIHNPIEFSANKLMENLAHRDTFLNSKFMRVRTAQEDWERSNVYGATYPEWSSPVDSFIQPMINRSTQRNPLAASASMGAVGYMFGASARAKSMGTVIGGAIGFGAATYGNVSEAITGDRFIPKERKKELMLEEQVDMLSYMHSMVNASRASQAGDTAAAQEFLNRSTQTMYGANLDGTPEQLVQSMPKRKREHFEAMMYAPEPERERILSTAPRLERRLLQAAWGQKVESLPDIQEFFQERELPSAGSSFWSPYTDMEAIKIKMGQHMGLDMAQMGYFPQQIQEANLINPEYPAIFSQTSGGNTRARIMTLLQDQGIRGSVERRPSPFSNGDRFQLVAGT